jgi:hypothetical protein
LNQSFINNIGLFIFHEFDAAKALEFFKGRIIRKTQSAESNSSYRRPAGIAQVL